MALTMTAQAQDIPSYDPGYLPLDLRQTRIDDCGIVIGADPTWPRTAVNDVTSTGKPRRGAEFKLGPAYWKSRPEKPGDFVVNPLFTLSVTCFPTTLTETGKKDGLKDFADRVRASAKKRPQEKPKRLKKFKATGLGTVYSMHTVTQSKTEAQWGAINDIANFYTLHRGNLVSIRIYIRRQPPARYLVDLPKGTVVTRTYDTGETLTFRLSAPAQQNILGTEIAASRKARENADLFETFRKSLGGY
jgi:hypothetical protein